MKKLFLIGAAVAMLTACASVGGNETFIAYPDESIAEREHAIVRAAAGIDWVSINGETVPEELSAGSVPMPVMLPPGTHTVVFNWADGQGVFAEDVEQEIVVAADAEYELKAAQGIADPDELFVTFEQTAGARELSTQSE